jgi:DNA-binding NarL/FixJ family response regulator
MQKLINVIVAENEKMFRALLISNLIKQNIHTIGEATNGLELLELLRVDKIIPDAILLDLNMPAMNGRVAFDIIRKEFPQIKIVILTGYSEGALINYFMENGAIAFVTKEDNDIEALAETIRKAKTHLIPFNNSDKALSSFTDGEQKIIPFIIMGLTNTEIAEKLNKAKSTIDGYLLRLCEKTGAKNGKELSSYCTLLGLNFLGIDETTELPD